MSRRASVTPLGISERYGAVEQDTSRLVNVEEEYDKAQLAKAKDHLKATSLRNENGKQYPVCSTSPQELSVFSLGVHLYFKFLKQMGSLFLIFFIICIPSLYFNIKGDYLSEEESSSFYDQATLANRVWKPTGSAYWDDPNNQKFLTVWLDIVGCVIFMLILQYMIYFNEKTKSEALRETITPGDYTVKIIGIPAQGVEEEGVKQFFLQRYGMVVECSFARKFGGILTKSRYLHKLNKKIEIEEKRLNAQGKATGPKLHDLLEEKDKKYRILQDSMPRVSVIEDLPCLHSYLTFNSVRSKIACIIAYQNWNDSSCLCYQPAPLRLNARFPIKYIYYLYIYIYILELFMQMNLLRSSGKIWRFPLVKK